MTQDDHSRLSEARSSSAPTAAGGVERLCIFVILFLGFLQAFNARYELNADGVSYLDLGDLWLKGDITNAVNGYWNPIYPILLSTACKFVNPINEPLAAHLVNFALLAFNLWLFKRLLRAMQSFREEHSSAPSAEDELFRIFGYLLFAWTHLGLIDLINLTPDLLVMSSVLGAAIALFGLLKKKNASGLAAALGAILAFGYLTKAIMFVAAPFFILAAVFCASTIKKGIQHSLIAAIVFGALASPYVLLLSRQQGHLTYSESGKLAYSWMVNHTQPWFHWQGREPGSGTPAHPTRQLSKSPDVFEFGDRPGTYPPWFDPSYWNKGLQVRPHLKNQLKAINLGLIEYYGVFLREPASLVFLILFGIGIRRAELRNSRALLRVWPLFIPAVAILDLYLLVLVMGRYAAPFILLIYSALLINCWPGVTHLLPQRALHVMALCGIIPIVFTICGQTIKANAFKRSEITEQRRIAIALREFGLKPGDRIAVLGRACNSHFPRLGRFKIVAEGFRRDDEVPLWAQRPEFELQAVQALKAAHPKAIIRDTPPQFDSALDWKPIPNTQFAALLPD